MPGGHAGLGPMAEPSQGRDGSMPGGKTDGCREKDEGIRRPRTRMKNLIKHGAHVCGCSIIDSMDWDVSGLQ